MECAATESVHLFVGLTTGFILGGATNAFLKIWEKPEILIYKSEDSDEDTGYESDVEEEEEIREKNSEDRTD